MTARGRSAALLAVLSVCLCADAAPAQRFLKPLSISGRAGEGFVENRGQFDPTVRFQLKTPSGAIWVTKRGLVFDVSIGRSSKSPDSLNTSVEKEPISVDRTVFAADFIDGLLGDIKASDPLPGSYNFLIGQDSSTWKTGLHSYREIVAYNLWPGIDLRLFVNGSGVEQEFILHSGSDPKRIRISYRGTEPLRVSPDGRLLISTPAGQQTESKPRVYQNINGRRVAIEARFKLVDTSSYAFAIGAYDRNYAVVVEIFR